MEIDLQIEDSRDRWKAKAWNLKTQVKSQPICHLKRENKLLPFPDDGNKVVNRVKKRRRID